MNFDEKKKRVTEFNLHTVDTNKRYETKKHRIRKFKLF